MKKSLLTSIFALAFGLGFAQNQFNASIPGTDADLKTSIDKGTLTFEIQSVSDGKQVDLLNNKAVPYKKEINVEVKLSGAPKAVAVVTLNDGAKDMKWLFRYFLNAGINQVVFNGKTQSTQDFFKPWL